MNIYLPYNLYESFPRFDIAHVVLANELESYGCQKTKNRLSTENTVK